MKQLKLFQNNFSQKDVNKILYWRKELRRAEREVFKCEKRHSYFKRRLFSASPINKDGSISLRKYKKKKILFKMFRDKLRDSFTSLSTVLRCSWTFKLSVYQH